MVGTCSASMRRNDVMGEGSHGRLDRRRRRRTANQDANCLLPSLVFHHGDAGILVLNVLILPTAVMLLKHYCLYAKYGINI